MKDEMNNQVSLTLKKSPIHRGRKILLWFIKSTFFLLVLLILGTIYETRSERADQLAYPPPGRMVNVGGYRLHINCTGIGKPTVVIESGWGDSSPVWGWVQPEVSKTTRVCSYDRAGMGWSESSPEPRTAREFAKELHSLLISAKETGPYMLVGHSLGGYTVRVYAHDYPAEVSGLVLIDAQDLPASDAISKPAPKPGRSSLALLARIGIVRLFAGALGAVENLPPGYKESRTAVSVTPQFVSTFLDEGRGMSQGGKEARSVTTLGTLPIIILSRGKDLDAKHTSAQTELLKLSTESEQLVAEKSGHRIMVEQPEAAVAAIEKILTQLKK